VLATLENEKPDDLGRSRQRARQRPRSRVRLLGINCLAVDPLRGDSVAVGGSDSVVRVLDRRMHRPGEDFLRFSPPELAPPVPDQSGPGVQQQQPSPASRHLTDSSLQITGVAFSRDGGRLLASYNDER
jgi:hypothetical protein